MTEAIPVRMLDGRTTYLPTEHVMAHSHHFNIHTNRRGHVRHAEVKARQSLVPLTHRGESFQQALDTGIVWALRGVVGSTTQSER